MVFQRFNLFPHLTAQNNVATALTTVRKFSRSDAQERAKHNSQGSGWPNALTPSRLSFLGGNSNG